ncbi:MAG: tetratricopeptide repeat protein [Gemmobacter sp.]
MMQWVDVFGQPLRAADRQTGEAWDAMALAFLAHGSATPTHLATVLARDPGLALAQAVRGLFCLLLGRREMVQTAREAQAAAHAALPDRPACLRERGLVAALDAWLDGRPAAAVAELERVLTRHPGDTLAMKIGHGIRFMLGDAAGMRASIERVLPAYAADHPGFGYLLGCHAFALEETGDYARAATAGRLGLGLAPDDAWGLHAVAHVHDMTGDARGGIAWLTGREAAWAQCNNFRYHVWWHKALLHLDLGETDVVLGLYDSAVRPERTDDYRDIANATSLLMRLELDGVDVGPRWDELAELSASRTEDGCLVFADLHYLLALVGGDRAAAAAQLMARMHRTAAESASAAGRLTAHPGLAAAQGLRAFGAGDYAGAYLNLARARGALRGIGGSHAQRDVFERLTIDAAIRAGFFDDARRHLAERRALRAGRLDGYAEARLALIAAALPCAAARAARQGAAL